MAHQVVMPQMGFDMKEARIVRWLKQEGDRVGRGDIIAEIETDKAVLEIEAFASGTLRRILAGEGEVVPVGGAIAIIAEPEEALPPLEAALPQAAPAPSFPGRTEARAKASPAARRLAQEKGIDLAQVRGTGPEGRIVLEDVEALLARREAAPALAGAELSPMRQAIARRMAQSKREAPHFYLTAEIDMTAALRLRQELNLSLPPEEHITINDLVVRAVALALARLPQLNAHFLEGRLLPQPKVNIGLAIALDDGLIAPALLDCAGKSLAQLAREARSLGERARGGRLKPEEYSQATFTVSNLGMYEVDTFLAIINPPQVAILAVGAVRPQPVVREGQIVIAEVIKASLSADHRAVDGAQAGQFLAQVKRTLEEPSSLLG